MVKVLPEPVTPSRVWNLSPCCEAGGELLDRLRLVPRGSNWLRISN